MREISSPSLHPLLRHHITQSKQQLNKWLFAGDDHDDHEDDGDHGGGVFGVTNDD